MTARQQGVEVSARICLRYWLDVVTSSDEYGRLLLRMRELCDAADAPSRKQIAGDLGNQYAALDHKLKGRRPISLGELYRFAESMGRRLVVDFAPANEPAVPPDAEEAAQIVESMPLPVRGDVLRLLRWWADMDEGRRTAILVLAAPVATSLRGPR